MPQAVATSGQPLPPQARLLSVLLLSPDLSEPETPVSCSFNPSCLGGEQIPSGNLHAEVGPNPKLNYRRCGNKEEKGKFLHAGSGAAD